MKRNIDWKRLLFGAALLVCLSVAVALYLRGYTAVRAMARPSEGLTFEYEADVGPAPERVACVPDGDDLCRVYLPACADPANTRMALEGGDALWLDGVRLENGMGLDGFKFDTPHVLTDARGREEHLVFTASSGLPALRQMLVEDVPARIEALAAGIRANTLRWDIYFAAHQVYHGENDYLFDYIEKRLAFLDSAWIDGVDYRTITFSLGEKVNYQFFCLPAGSSCESIPTPQDYLLPEGAVWLLEDGTPFDRSGRLLEDITLFSSVPAAAQAAGSAHAGE